MAGEKQMDLVHAILIRLALTDTKNSYLICQFSLIKTNSSACFCYNTGKKKVIISFLI